MKRGKKCMYAGGELPAFDIGGLKFDPATGQISNNFGTIQHVRLPINNGVPKIDLGLTSDYSGEALAEGSNVPYYSEPAPVEKGSLQDSINKGLIKAPEGYASAQDAYDHFQREPDPVKQPNRMGWMPYLTSRFGVAALTELSGRAERGRQDQYYYNQLSTIGQTSPIPVENFQPNPYRLYAKYGGNLKKYANGGALEEAYNFLFEDDVEPKKPGDIPTAPSATQVQSAPEVDPHTQMMQDLQDNLAMEEAMSPPSNSYHHLFGNDMSQGGGALMGAGQHGQQIIQEVSAALGYTPQFNSVYRDAAKQQQLVKQGVGVPNSWHLTGDAVDMKPQDWNKLPKTTQNQFRRKYDVVSHNNHVHLEPKGRRMGDGGKYTPKY